MNWISLSLLAAFISAGVAVTDRFFVTRYFEDSFAYSLFIRGYDLLLAALVAWVTGTIALLPFPAMAWALAGGAIQVVTWWAYFKAVSRADPSWIAAFSQIKPLTMVPVGLLIFSEHLSALNYAGVVVIILAALLLSIERDALHDRRWQVSDAVVPMIIYILASSLTSVFIRIGLENEASNNVYFWQQLGAAACSLVVLAVVPSTRARLRSTLQPYGLKVYLGSLAGEVILTISGLLGVAALARGPIGPVTALGGVRPLFVAWLVHAVNEQWPGAVPLERHDHLLPRWVVVMMIVAGVYLVGR
jgi:drug/metabolite transporter (DMT)-like permease